MLQIIISILLIIISYYVGLYRGMMKAKNIAKKHYRQFGIYLPEDFKSEL